MLKLAFTRVSPSQVVFFILFYAALCLTLVTFGFCLQRAPPHQIGDTTLPRSDPNLSAPDKGKTLRLVVLLIVV